MVIKKTHKGFTCLNWFTNLYINEKCRYEYIRAALSLKDSLSVKKNLRINNGVYFHEVPKRW